MSLRAIANTAQKRKYFSLWRSRDLNGFHTSWVRRPNPEDRINRKWYDQIVTQSKSRQNNKRDDHCNKFGYILINLVWYHRVYLVYRKQNLWTDLDTLMSPPCQFYNTGFIYLKPKLYIWHQNSSLNKTSEVLENKHLKILFLLSLGNLSLSSELEIA